MIYLNEIQKEIKEWTNKNFPNTDASEQVIGMTEELGELAHHFLKWKQGIRNDENHREGIIDAVGDLMIYLMNFCSIADINLEHTIEKTWNKVEQRDWNKERAGDNSTITK